MKQKDIFIRSEADEWFKRNHEVIQKKIYDYSDPVIQSVSNCLQSEPLSDCYTLLEIGCGEAKRLEWISKNLGVQCVGIEPSKLAAEKANTIGVSVAHGTADELPFKDSNFDFVVFGFCLYLCDRGDLFKIAKEADRVLKENGWIIINDFYSKQPIDNPYSHNKNVVSYKMDYRKLFDWHPDYTCWSHDVRHHSNYTYTDDAHEWVATSILRKCSRYSP